MRKRLRRLWFVLPLILLIGVFVWMLWTNQALELNTYTISSDRLPESFDGFRIAQISDLHNAQMGADNEKLLQLLRQAQPDMIAITGDLVDSRKTDTEVALAFVTEAVKIAPCYYVPGNHEARLTEYGALRQALEELGVSVLENTGISFEKDGASIYLAGVLDPAFRADDQTPDEAVIIADQLQDMALDRDDFILLLSHRPELLEIYAQHGADLVLSGHVHGGQFRLPGLGGLFAPSQGFFPEYDAGLYTDGATTMLVSRGIGNSLFPLRFNNPPEVLLITLKSA